MDRCSEPAPAGPLLEPERITRLTGYGMAAAADGYVYRPTRVEELRDCFSLARLAGRKIVLRGAGRSYGDA
ncbi:MAG TPA: FAD-binding protein, partial [Armatimonadota bacterium]|nr:FAD-binding protein [Armatimonadota bacterium]